MIRAGPFVLAVDVGGTQTGLAVFERTPQGWLEVASRMFASAEQPGLEAPTRAFLEALSTRPHAAVFAVAGPVAEGVCRTTNLPSTVDAQAFGAALGIERLAVINDFEAAAHGLFELGPEHFVVFCPVRIPTTSRSSAPSRAPGFVAIHRFVLERAWPRLRRAPRPASANAKKTRQP